MLPASYHFEDPRWSLHNAIYPLLSPSYPKELGYGGRAYQVRRHNQLKGKRLTITIAPTGSGKSLMQVFDAAIEILESNYKQKQVFIVNMLNIGNGFTENKHKSLKINGKDYDWLITENCLDGPDTVRRIKEFLLKKKHPLCKPYKEQNVIGGITAIVSYDAFLAAWKQMTPSEKKFAIKKTSFRVDEIHHISGVSDNESYELNRMGSFFKYLLKHKNVDAHLTTATFFRSNRNPIFDGKYYKRFSIYRIQFLEHWENLGLRELHQNYAAYKDGQDLMNQILEEISAEKQPSLIIVPSAGHKFFKKSNKLEWVKDIVTKLGKIYGPEKVLDLVSPNRQSKDKEKFISETQDFMVVVTCAIGKEGSDWPACSRIFNTVLDQAVLSALQKLGRGLRSYPGKTDVKMTNYMEHFGKWDDEPEKVRKKLSDRFNCVIVQSMLDDEFYPIFSSLPIDKNDPNSVPKFVTLTEIFGEKRNDVIKELLEVVSAIPNDERTGETIDEAIEQVMESFSEDMLEEVDLEELKKRLRKELVRRMNPNDPNLKLDGVIVDFIRKNGWDKVVRESIAYGSPFVGKANTKDLKELQNYLMNDWMVKYNEVKRLGVKHIQEHKDKHPELYRWVKLNHRFWRQQNAR